MTSTAAKPSLTRPSWLMRLPFLGATSCRSSWASRPQAAGRSAELENLGWVEWVTPRLPSWTRTRLYALTGGSLGGVAEQLPGSRRAISRGLPGGAAGDPAAPDATGDDSRAEPSSPPNSSPRHGDIEVDLADARSLPWAGRRRRRWWPPEVEGYGCLRWGSWRAPFFVAWDRAGAPPIHRRKRVAGWYAFWNSEHPWGGDDIPPILVLHPARGGASSGPSAVLRASDRRQVAPLQVFLTMPNVLRAKARWALSGGAPTARLRPPLRAPGVG